MSLTRPGIFKISVGPLPHEFPMSDERLSFGPFELSPSRRQLLRNDQPVALGSRALDILILLTERAGDLVSHREITERVWPDTFVEEANRRVHINLLRKALGDSGREANFIASVPGRGYRFVAPVARSAQPVPPPRPESPTLPAMLGRVIGREDTVRTVIGRLQERRLVTIVGTGGIGKTTAAIAITRTIADRYERAPAFIDFVPLRDGERVAVTLAAVLNVTVRADGIIPDLIRFLHDKRLLLVFDNCEHVIEEAAALAEAILKAAPGIHILATSREPLRADGEWVHRLAPLGLPDATEADLTAARALEFSAVELFVERAMAGPDGFGLSDADAAEVARLCRSLDGIPLAIELAAARVAAFGIREVARSLDRPLDLLRGGGRRTAQARHRTLAAVLDWSHTLLSPAEQTILRRLSIFPASFEFEAAAAVVFDDASSPWTTSERLGDLAAKSMLAVQHGRQGVVYRLLETTRAYATHKLRLAEEEDAVMRRHADYFRERLDALAAIGYGDAELATAAPLMDDVRAALDRTLHQGRDIPRGLALIGAAAHFWLRLAMLHEHHAYLELAAEQLRAGHQLPPEVEFRLQMGRGMTLFVRNNDVPGAESALERGLTLARATGDQRGALKTLGALFAIEAAHGNYGAEARYADEYGALADAMADPPAINVHKRMHSRSLHDLGEQDAALALIDVQLAQMAGQTKRPQLGANEADSLCIAYATWARIMWMRGFPDQALAGAERGFARAIEIESTQTACWILVFNMCPINLWRGDLAATRRHVDDLQDRSHKTFERWYDPWCDLYQKVLASIESGQPPAAPLAKVPVQADLIGTFAPLLLDAVTAGRAAADERTWCAAEILRARAEQLMDMADLEGAENLLDRSYAIARRQGALSWALRTATSLARLHRLKGRPADGIPLLRAVYGQFTEGFLTADLAAARVALN